MKLISPRISLSVFLFFGIMLTVLGENDVRPFTILKHYFLSDMDSSVYGQVHHVYSHRSSYRASCEKYTVDYSYLVDGIRYTSDLVSYDTTGCSRSQKLPLEFKAGQKVKVYFDSNKPQYSLLKVSSIPYYSLFLLFSAWLFSELIAWCYAGLKVSVWEIGISKK